MLVPPRNQVVFYVMPEIFCPQCGATGRYLRDASRHAQVNYYRCDECWHVWALDRQHPEYPPKHVTPVAKTAAPE